MKTAKTKTNSGRKWCLERRHNMQRYVRKTEKKWIDRMWRTWCTCSGNTMKGERDNKIKQWVRLGAKQLRMKDKKGKQNLL